MTEEITHEERIPRVTGKLKCAPPSPRFKLCRDNDAEYVCHECGSPLCVECMTETTDRKFYILRSGVKRMLVSIAVLVLLPLLTILSSRYVGVGAVGGVISALMVSVALLSPLELLRRAESDQSGKSVSRFRIVIKDYTKAVHCRNCVTKHATESKVGMGIVAFGIIFLLLGFYGIIQASISRGSFDGFLILASLGIAVLLAKNILLELAVDYLPRWLRI